MGAAEEELGTESEVPKRGERQQLRGKIAERNLSTVLQNPPLRSQGLV